MSSTTRCRESKSAVGKGEANQGIAFCTFFGYSKNKLATLLGHFFDDARRVTSPRPIIEVAPLKFVVASVQSELGVPLYE